MVGIMSALEIADVFLGWLTGIQGKTRKNNENSSKALCERLLLEPEVI
jgi:hypothetical protein